MCVVYHRDVMPLQRARREFRIGVVIVITEHGPNTFRRAQGRQRFRARLDVAAIRGAVVAGEHKHVGLCLLRDTDYAADFADAEDTTVMNIRELRDAKAFE